MLKVNYNGLCFYYLENEICQNILMCFDFDENILSIK